MDTFNDENLTPDQIKMLTLQFMGQHLTGELKELDKNLVAKNQTLQGMVLDPTAVINSIPSSGPSLLQQSPPQIPQLTPQFQVQQAAIPTTASQAIEPPANKDQLEFNFNTSPLSERIFEALQRIEKKISLIEDRLVDVEDFKKKD
jgi:hypothetical protein